MKKKTNFNRKQISILLVFIILFIFVGIKINFVFTQKRVDSLVQKGGYPEIVGRVPTFQKIIKTPDSTTNVLSYLPDSLLPEEKFNPDSASEAIAYVEKITQEKKTFKFNPFVRDGFEVGMKMIPRWKSGVEHYVFFISDKDPVPQILSNIAKDYPLLSESIKNKKTFFWTQLVDKGSVSFIRYAEPKTWQYGLPSVENIPLNSSQQLNIGFNIEIWKRTAAFITDPEDMRYDNHEDTVFRANESLWNTFGQLMTAKQEGTSKSLMKWRHNEHVLSEERNRKYYPFDEIAEEIYENAPTALIVR